MTRTFKIKSLGSTKYIHITMDDQSGTINCKTLPSDPNFLTHKTLGCLPCGKKHHPWPQERNYWHHCVGSWSVDMALLSWIQIRFWIRIQVTSDMFIGFLTKFWVFLLFLSLKIRQAVQKLWFSDVTLIFRDGIGQFFFHLLKKE